MILEGFIQGTSDEELLKSLSTENISEDLVKAMNKAGLVQKEVQVKGKNGQTFTRKQWVRASDSQSADQSSSQSKQANSKNYKHGSVDEDGNLVVEDKSNLTDLVEEITGTDLFDAKDLADKDISPELQKTSHYDGHFIETMEYESARLVGNKVEIHGRVYGDIDLDDGDKEPFDKTVTFSIPVKSSKPTDSSNASTQYKSKINHNTGVHDKPKTSMLEDYFTGNHGHSDSKSALVALLGKGYSRQDIMSQAEKSGITWKKNDHEGINWMRASMAIQKAWKKG